jgi:hypothetical protein
MIRVPLAWLNWFTLRRSIAWIAIIGGGYALMVWRAYSRGDDPSGSVTVLSLLAPAVAFVLAPAIVGLFVGYVGWTRERTWEPWQGRYYAFDDHQVRVTEKREQLWFASADVHDALGVKRRDGTMQLLSVSQCVRDEELGELLSNEGLVALFGTRTERNVLRFIAWAERDVRRPWQNQRDGVKVDAAVRSARSPAGVTNVRRP